MSTEKTVGETIRQAREEKGLSQEEVSRVTRLSLSIIRRLEQDRFAELPEGLYLQNYVRILGEHLGLDVGALMAILHDRAVAGQGGSARSQTWQVESVPEIRVAGHASHRWLWITIAIIVVIGGLVAAAILLDLLPDSLRIWDRSEAGTPFGNRLGS